MEHISGIYCIKNIYDGTIYIGKSIDIHRRWRDEKSSLKRGDFHNVHMQRVYDKYFPIYGENLFEFTIIEKCDVDMLFERECFWISCYDSYHNGYNQTEGGDGSVGAICSEEKRLKLQNAHLGQKNWNIRSVYCIELNQEFWGAKEAEDLYKERYNVRRNGIAECCKGKKFFCGKLEDGTQLHWCYTSEKDNFIIPIQPRNVSVFCIELNKYYMNIQSAVNDPVVLKAYNGNIKACCEGHPQHKTCGHLSDGTKLTWRYATTDEIQHYLVNN